MGGKLITNPGTETTNYKPAQ